MFCIKDVILNILEDSGLYWMTFLSTPRQLYLRMVMWRHDTHSHIHWENHRKILRKLSICPKMFPFSPQNGHIYAHFQRFCCWKLGKYKIFLKFSHDFPSVPANHVLTIYLLSKKRSFVIAFIFAENMPICHIIG